MPKKYADLIDQFPDILQAKFKKETDSAIYHQIDTVDSKPHKCKVRPIQNWRIQNSQKKAEKYGKKWKKLV